MIINNQNKTLIHFILFLQQIQFAPLQTYKHLTTIVPNYIIYTYIDTYLHICIPINSIMRYVR